MRLVRPTGACWLMPALRDAIPRPQPLARAEFTTLRARLPEIAAGGRPGSDCQISKKALVVFSTCRGRESLPSFAIVYH